MLRITKIAGKYYGIELPEDDELAIIEVQQFNDDGIPVIIVSEVSDLHQLDIHDNVEIIERD